MKRAYTQEEAMHNLVRIRETKPRAFPADGLSRATRLDEAANLVNDVLGALDLAEDGCEHCGLKRKRNMSEFKAAQELLAIVNKLEKWAGVFEESDS